MHVKRVKLLWVVEVGRLLCFSVTMKRANAWRELTAHRLAQKEADVLRDRSPYFLRAS